LKEILDKNWPVLSKRLPKNLQDRKKLGLELNELNRIRNAVMHPIKGIPFSDDTFAKVRTFQRELIRSEGYQQISWSEILANIPAKGPLQ
jgi:hypothetical protein